MNRIFYWIVVIAFIAAAARELLVTVPQVELVPALVELRSQVDVGAAPNGRPITPMAALTVSIFDAAKLAVELALKFVGGMALFLGLMKVVEVGGGLAIMAKVIRPLMVRLFPKVPADHPAMGAMIMNLSANALGLGNAATPFGVRAMQELDKLNPHKGTATNAMALFLTINTSSVTLLATGVVVIRQELGSTMAAAVIPTTLLATVFSTTGGMIVCKLLERWSPAPPATDPIDTTSEGASESYPMVVSIGALVALLVSIPVFIRFGDVVSAWLIPVLIVGFLTFGAWRGVKVYEVLVDGAKEGFNVAIRIIPYLVAILVAVAMLRASGALDAFIDLVGPFTSRIGLPAEALPMALLRPLSGSGASGVMMATMANPETGPDTYVGLLVSTLQGSSETTFYVLAVYYGAVGVQNIRHTLAAALTADVLGVVGSVLAVNLYLWFT